ncbi:hypothetical protein GCM10010452_21950 [Crossiella cryophila]
MVCERRSTLDGGAGIGLMPNALRTLDALGLGTQVRACAESQLAGGLRPSSGTGLPAPALGCLV